MKETVAIQLRTLYIANLPNLKHLWNEDPLGLVLFHNLSSVYVMDCPNLKFIFPASIAKNLPQLETLHIRSCGVEEIVAQDQGLEATSEFVFPCLKFLTFGELYELKCFYPGIHTLESPMLKSLAVNHCEEVNIFCSEYENLVETNKECQLMTQVLQPLFSFRKIVPNLEQLTLSRKDVTIIWQNQFPADLFRKLKVVEIHCFHDESEVFPFHLLERFRYTALRIVKLPDLTDIWNQDSQLDYVLQPLENLVVSECNSLITLAPSSASFQNLTTLDVWKCNGLVSLVTSSTAKSLVQLTIMSIKKCDGLKEVVANEGEESKEDIIFSKLESLEFDCLPSLISFCSADHSFKFPSLTKVIVKQCPKMQVFSKGVLSTPRLLGVEKDDQWHWNGNLNAAMQQLFAETVQCHGTLTHPLCAQAEIRPTLALCRETCLAVPKPRRPKGLPCKCLTKERDLLKLDFESSLSTLSETNDVVRHNRLPSLSSGIESRPQDVCGIIGDRWSVLNTILILRLQEGDRAKLAEAMTMGGSCIAIIEDRIDDADI
ncbi:hypothetical protein GH714_024476 [Hevea brasiliensis]|uniref:Disease resistance protein At4g27190-like leucine-rich repeats domain-containing protein n=1 Tax=Hevea brasiliensis TaxID=3981 RepID=A0A6A6LDJ2_HEVBR|nr:hypothetical protein GH714_024476 [Hevea brasiliensis]